MSDQGSDDEFAMSSDEESEQKTVTKKNSSKKNGKGDGESLEESKSSSKDSISSTRPEENVRVVVRVRPMNETEIKKQCRDIVTVNKELNAIELNVPPSSVSSSGDELRYAGGPKSFRFDAVFAPDTSQADVYNLVARPIVQNVIEGYNGTIFAYGQTGTGKTFTMEGDNNVPELKGIIPNSFAQIFSHISHASGERRFLVRVSYLEIYNEDVRDLLGKDPNKKLEVKESKDTGVYVKGLESTVVTNADEMDKIMMEGNKSRSTASTKMNAVSSRSHAIFTIRVEASLQAGDGSLSSIRMGKLNLVDLAGSERVAKTGATGQRLLEGTKINLSLSSLGNVISALVEGQSHIPYRNSKLTRLLQDSLGGNAKTVMCANIGPADYNYDETVSTLRYADRAKHIKNHAIINEDPKDALLRQFQNEIEELRRQLMEEDADPKFHENRQRRDSQAENSDEESGEENSFTDKNSGSPARSHETVKGIKGEIQTFEQLANTVEVDSNERHIALHKLKENVESWKQHEEKRAALREKLRSMKRKIMVGGENLLDKSQQQEEFLQRSMQELDQRKKEELRLRDTLSSKKVERAKSEGKILQLQSENAALTKKLKKCWKLYLQEKSDLDLLVDECGAEEESILEEINRSSKELAFMNHMIGETIPREYQEKIEKCCGWNDDTGRWSLPCIAYTGNNIHRTPHEHSYHGHRQQLNRKLKDISFVQPSLFETASDEEPSGGQRASRSDRIFDRRQMSLNNCPDIISSTVEGQQRFGKISKATSLKSARSLRDN